jgi:hypothetical protein
MRKKSDGSPGTSRKQPKLEAIFLRAILATGYTDSGYAALPADLTRVHVMSIPQPKKPLHLALYVNAALLALIAMLLVARGNSPPLLPAAFGQGQLPIGGGAGLFIVPAQFSTSTYGCYILDVDQQTVCAYQFTPTDKTLRLVAARSFRNDRKLHNFNSPSPSPEEVGELLEHQQHDARAKEQNKQKSSPEAPSKE